MDTSITMTVNVQKDDRSEIGYKLLPKLYFSRPKGVESVFGMVDEYLEGENVIYRVKELDASNRLEIQNIEGIRKFLEPIVSGFIQQRDRAEYFLDDVLPELKGGSYESQEKFIEAMEVVDELREYPIRPRRSSKYDADYFREEWDRE